MELEATAPDTAVPLKRASEEVTIKREESVDQDVLHPEARSSPSHVAKKRKLSEEVNKEPSKAGTPAPGSTPPAATIIAPTPRPPTFNPSPDGLPYFTTADTPMNRQGFRYTPAGPSPPGCILSQRTVESQPAGYVRVSWEDRSPYVRVSADGLGLLGEKGFRSARLNVPVKEGKWYLEIKVEKGGGDGAEGNKDGAHIRLGWGRREAPLNGPGGLDGYSYAYRDKTGDKVTLSRPKPYGKPFGSGDVIGLYISLPPRRKPKEDDPTDPARVLRKRIAINYKNQLYFESMDYAQVKEMTELMDLKKPTTAPSKKDATVKDSQNGQGTAASRRRKSRPLPMAEAPALRQLPTLGPESCIAFFRNGECQGPAFTDLYDYLQLKPLAKKDIRSRRNLPIHLRERENFFDDGSLGYYPFLSVFNDARLSINAGPNFDFPPPPDVDRLLFPDKPSGESSTPTWRPLCERYAEFMNEEFAQDELDEVEAQKTRVATQNAREAERVAEEAKAAKKKQQEAKKASKKASAKGKRSTLGTEVITAEDLAAMESAAADGADGGNAADDEAPQVRATSSVADGEIEPSLAGVSGHSSGPTSPSASPEGHVHSEKAGSVPRSTTSSNEARTPASSEGPEMIGDQDSDDDQAMDETGAEVTDDENLLAGDAASANPSEDEDQAEGPDDSFEVEDHGQAPVEPIQSTQAEEGYESDVEMVADATQL
ncbi:hypothetical protein FS837_010349 [Tulasnella sp. UAMH 9824]|nr:hypothetical protein FS837_010349 [Tulasnella sp. UAMH 9824]